MKKILTLLTLLIFVSNFAYCETISTDSRPKEPTEVYGSEGEIALLLGNGGAGPTCLLQELSEDFIKENKLKIRIGWIQTISRLTLENLKEKIIDMSLTYEEEPELQAVKEKWASERALIFNDHFILVGPKANPGGVQPTDSIEMAFKKIAASNASFFSRNDSSGSNERELSIWKELQINPFEMGNRYVTQRVFPADALTKADKEGLYTLTDRGTLIATKDELHQTAVYIQNGEKLMNRCHALLQKEPSQYANMFLNYLKSERAQQIIENYKGKNKADCKTCCPLFTNAKEDVFIEADCLEKLGLQ
ncbi:MAG: hypothetical protein LW832_03420 [Parachlamydia sp.]|jgi:ABC-type tungstate transport system permease subunit|nr:hypothetical protein [Parachlamydia sp.]